MGEMKQCLDSSAIVEYLYDEVEPVSRERIAAHIAECASCAAEVEALRATRGVLAQWTPPSAALGFQLTETEALGLRASEATVLRPKQWWSRPLPAWAQAAAAVAIFATGMAIGSVPRSEPSARVTSNPAPLPAPAVVTENAPIPGRLVGAGQSVSHEDLARVERQLRSEMAQLRTVSAPAARADEGDVMRRVETLIAESEARQRREFVLNTARALENYDAYRRADLVQMQRTQGLTGAEVRQHREAIAQINNLLVNVSQVR